MHGNELIGGVFKAILDQTLFSLRKWCIRLLFNVFTLQNTPDMIIVYFSLHL